jgi:hypothetical protein
MTGGFAAARLAELDQQFAAAGDDLHAVLAILRAGQTAGWDFADENEAAYYRARDRYDAACRRRRWSANPMWALERDRRALDDLRRANVAHMVALGRLAEAAQLVEWQIAESA